MSENIVKDGKYIFNQRLFKYIKKFRKQLLKFG